MVTCAWSIQVNKPGLFTCIASCLRAAKAHGRIGLFAPQEVCGAHKFRSTEWRSLFNQVTFWQYSIFIEIQPSAFEIMLVCSSRPQNKQEYRPGVRRFCAWSNVIRYSTYRLFSRSRSLYAVAVRLSVCRLSVTFVHPTLYCIRLVY